MPDPIFIHLRVHSAYSLSEGAIAVKDLVKLAKKLNMPAVAMTDTNNLFGSLEFSQSAAGGGVQPIIGCQLSFASLEKNTQVNQLPEQLSLYAQNETGYFNLLKLASKAYLSPALGVAPLLAYESLEGLTEGIIALSGGVHGAVGRALLAGRKDMAEMTLKGLSALFPDRFYLELQRHHLPDERKIEAETIDLAYTHNIPLVATNDAYFATRDMYEAHDALLCVAEGTYVTQENRRRMTPEHYFKSQEEMATLFADLPEALENTVHIARRCAFMSPSRKPILPGFASDKSEAETLREQAWAGLEERLKNLVFTEDMSETEREAGAEPYRKRLEFELDVIIQMGFPGYFLIVSDFIKWSKAQDIPVGPGRGSGAGSAVAWSLSITDLDPLRYGLLFERFLNPERVSMPDFDVDFCQDGREEVIRYVQEKYGADHVAQIITFGKLQARAVLRDVGRVLQIPYGQVDRISKLVPNNPANPVTLQQAIDMEPQLRRARDEDETIAKLIQIALQLEGLYRHASTHAAGVVIGDRKLDELVPMYRDPKSDMQVVQYSMKYAEIAGLVKFDFLGLKTLSVLKQAVKFTGEVIDLLKLPEGDKKTYELLAKGETIGVFQFESAGMRDALCKLKPDCLEDLIALGALYRPGPMDNIPTYIACKHGRQKPDYLHPMLEEVLKETHGVIIYQEQVLQIARTMGGYSLGSADFLRRAMGKKIKEEMDSHRDQFTEGALKNGVSKEKASTIFDQVAKFAGYGFNKAHSTCYALIAYQTAYLKANYPHEFIAASMNYDMHNTDKLSIFRQDASNRGIATLPPDVNVSDAIFTVEKTLGRSPHPIPLPMGEGSERKAFTGEGKTIRYGLAALKNVGEAAMKALVEEREAHGKFKDIFDFAGRLDAKIINKRALENLIKSGALDSIHPNRCQAFESIDLLLAYANAKTRDRESNQVSLFGAAQDMAKPALKEVKDWLPLERLHHEFGAVGFYLSAHPLSGYAKNLARMGVVSSGKFMSKLIESYTNIKIAGIVTGIKSKVSDKGRFAFIGLSDVDGVFEVSVFDETLLNSARPLLEIGKLVMISADGKRDDGGIRLIAQGISALDEAVMKNQRGEAHIYIEDAKAFLPLQSHLNVFKKKGAGIQIKLFVPIDVESCVIIQLADTYSLPPSALTQLEGIEGISQAAEG